MSRLLLVGLLAVSMGSHAAAQTAEQEIVKAEQARVAARRAADSAALGRILSDDLVQITNGGLLQNKKYAASLIASPKMGLRDLKTRFFGDVAVVTGVQTNTGATAPAD